MDWTRKSLANPAAVAVFAAIILLLGVITLFRLPVQLFPDIEQPQITIQASWRAASPREVESEIIKPLEEVLQGIPGVEKMQAFANRGNAFLILEFALETDMNKATLEVISRLNRLPSMPADSDPPIINFSGFGGGATDTLIWFFAQSVGGTADEQDRQRRFMEDVVAPKLEAIEGVSAVNIVSWNGSGDELRIIFDPYRAANLGVSLTELAARIGNSNDVSGGFVDVGRRQYTLRFQGRYAPDQLAGLIIDWRDGRPVMLGDIATIEIGPGRVDGFGYQNGNPAFGVQILKANGANVLETLDRVKSKVAEMNRGEIGAVGLELQKSFDPSVFILRAIKLLTNNLLIGVVLAMAVLWWFLRQSKATLIIAMTIPLSLLGTFVVLYLAGRSVNVISLAGLAFATGMVLDAAIVVLENIVRLRERGVAGDQASEKGTKQVWGALLASTATTVAIFVPVIFIKDVEGQLFSDLALTIAIAVTISLVVAVTVLPTAARAWIKDLPSTDSHTHRWDRLADKIAGLTDSPRKRAGWVMGLLSVPVVATLLLMPTLNYLPPVKRDAVDAFIQFPAGTNMALADEEVAKVIVARLQPYMDGEKEPALLNYYLFSFQGGNGAALGVRAKDQGKVKELERIVRDEILADLPDIRAFAFQGNLFGNFGGNLSIDIHIQSIDQEGLKEAAVAGLQAIRAAFPNSSVNPQPDPTVAAPELRLTPNDRRIAEVGWTRAEIANIVRALGDGLWLGEHFDGDGRMDIILKPDRWADPEALAAIPLATPSGEIVPLGELVRITRGVGPVAVRRVDGRRTITLQFNPPDGMALEEALNILQEKVEPEIRAALPPDGSIIYGGSADGLKRAINTLGLNFLLALGLLFLIMAALFRSAKDSALVVISIPLATVGGVVALRILNEISFQPMDLLTMIGFIILLGLVVNNAILLVVQTRRSEAEGESREQAVRTALRLRLRPIFMSTLTSIFGMAPLLLIPGEGSAIYRGMAAAIVGGMSVSTLFTLILLPSLLRMELSFGRWRGARARPTAALTQHQAAE